MVLSHIFLECSWTSARPNHELFGHLSPPHLLDELVALAREVFSVRRPLTEKILDSQLEGVLRGVTLVIIHCKEPIGSPDPGNNIVDVIVGEVKALVYPMRLGISVIGARQGMNLRKPYTSIIWWYSTPHATHSQVFKCYPNSPLSTLQVYL